MMAEMKRTEFVKERKEGRRISRTVKTWNWTQVKEMPQAEEKGKLPEGEACKEKTKKPTKADIRWAITHIFDILFNSFNIIDAFRCMLT